ncbi:MAG: hypothetical protein LBQ31_04705 [Bacteroidales bacterium]|jgi:hypothetical protein|nr:hypothetical protein [Bacteroidales bacterium]
MKKLYLVILALLLSVTVAQAEVLQQHFSSAFNTNRSSVVDTVDGWTYVNMNVVTSPVYYGTHAAYSYWYSTTFGEGAYIQTPEKTGGVGWVSFFYKVVPWFGQYAIDFKIMVQTSADGNDWVSVDSVPMNAKTGGYLESDPYQMYSRTINDVNAKYVRLWVDYMADYKDRAFYLDEFSVTDYGKTAVENPKFDILPVYKDNGELKAWSDLETNVGTPVSNIAAMLLYNDHTLGTLDVSVAGTAFSATEATFDFNANATDTATINVVFNPTKYNNNEHIKLSGAGYPELYFPISGIGITDNVGETFDETNYFPYGSFYYNGWQFTDGGISANEPFEGESSASVSQTLISPKKFGGVGMISFMYRNRGYDYSGFTVYVSDDRENWTIVGTVAASTDDYQEFVVKVDSVNAKYVKVYVSEGNKQLYIDNFRITPMGIGLADVLAEDVVTSYSGTPSHSFQVPLNFTGISGDVSVAFDSTQFVATTPIPQANATGTYNLDVTYTPKVEDKNFMINNLTLSGGGLSIAKVISVMVYEEVTEATEDFDTDWAGSGSAVKASYTSNGWKIEGGQRDIYNKMGATGAAVNMNGALGGAVTSCPFSNGVGDVRFYVESGWTSVTLVIDTSEDGITWAEAKSLSIEKQQPYVERIVVVQSQTAKWVKIRRVDGDYGNAFIDSITITTYGDLMATVNASGSTKYGVTSGVPAQVTLTLRGHGFTANPTVSLKSGNEFKINGKTDTVINIADINDLDFVLPLTITTTANTSDTIVVSSGDISADYQVIVSALILQDNVFIDFDEEWPGSLISNSNTTTNDGWAVINGTRNDWMTQKPGSVAFLTLDPPGSLTTPPLANGVGDVKLYASSSLAGYIFLQTSVDGETWITKDSSKLAGNGLFEEINLVIGDATAEYVRFVTGKNMSCQLDDISIVNSDSLIPSMRIVSVPSVFEALTGAPQEKILQIKGHGLTGDVNVAVSGADFSSTVQTITAAALNDVTYDIPVSFDPAVAEDPYCEAVITLSSSEISTQNINIVGISLQDYISQDFNTYVSNMTDWTYDFKGWFCTGGSEWGGRSGAAASIAASSSSRLLSIPKSGGVGIVSFYYKNYYGAVKYVINVYDTLDNTPVYTDTIDIETVPSNYIYSEVVINSETGKYVEFKNLPLDYNPLFIDDVYITPNGKGIPKFSLLSETEDPYTDEIVYTFEGETAQLTVKVFAENFDGNTLKCTLLNANGQISLDVNSFVVVGNSVKQTITATFTSGIPVDATLQVTGLGLSGSYALHGYTYSDIIEEDFSNFSSIGQAMIDSAIIKRGWDLQHVNYQDGFIGLACNTRNPDMANFQPYLPNGRPNGVLTSPVKLSGVDSVTLDHQAPYDRTGFILQITEDGNDWISIDTVINELSYTLYHYAIKINNANATQVRFLGTTVWDYYYSDNDPALIKNLRVTPIKPYLDVNTNIHIDTTEVPITIPVEVTGVLLSDATVALGGGNGFTCAKTTITPAELSGGQTVVINVEFNQTVRNVYNDSLVITNGGLSEPVVVRLEVNYTEGVGISATVSKNQVKAYINNDILYISGANTGDMVMVTNTIGRVLYNAKMNAPEMAIRFNEPRGVYVIKVGQTAFKLLK